MNLLKPIVILGLFTSLAVVFPTEKAKTSTVPSPKTSSFVTLPHSDVLQADLIAFTYMEKNLGRSTLEALILNQPYTNSLLNSLELKQVRILRNTAFALGGARFKSKDLQTWFGQQDWYVANKSAHQVKLSLIARQNIKITKLIERHSDHTSHGAQSFVQYRNGIVVFDQECDGECPRRLVLFAIKDGKELAQFEDGFLNSDGRLVFWQRVRAWKPSENNPGPPGWGSPQCEDMEKDLQGLDCQARYKTALQFKPDEDLDTVLRRGFLMHPTLEVTPDWECICSS